MNALAQDLQAGFEILWYRIDSVLGRGGFGITYLATDTNLGQPVAIKEYLPHDFASRSSDSTVQPVSREKQDMYSWGLDRFMSEAQTLAKFKHPNIVRVLSVFKHNNTGYMVMEYEQGRPLDSLYKKNKRFTQQELENIYYPIMEGLAAVHKEGFIHRDIKPANIYIREDGSPVLLDFGAARLALGAKTQALTSMYSVGYAPFEQYNEGNAKQGPWTDIYALAACLHHGVTGRKPIEATQRGMALLHDEPDPHEPLSWKKFLKGYDPVFLRGIDQGLMLQTHDRPQTLEEFRDMLSGRIELEELPRPEKSSASAALDKTVIRSVKRKFRGKPVAQVQRPQKDEHEPSIATTQKTEYYDKTTVIADEAIDDVIATDRLSPTEKTGMESRRPRQRNKAIWLGTALLLSTAIIIGIYLSSVSDQPTPTGETAGTETPLSTTESDIERLLSEADSLYRQGILYDSGDANAYQRYRQVLELDTRNTTANERLQLIAMRLMTRAKQSIDDLAFANAHELLTAIHEIDPTFPDLKQQQQILIQRVQGQKREKQIDILLINAEQALSRGHIHAPRADSAYDYYMQVLALDTENLVARQGMTEVYRLVVEDARAAVKNGKTEQANELLELAQSIKPDDKAVKALRQQIANSTQLNDLLRRADQAFARRQYTTPKSENAIVLYTRVLTLSPNHVHAKSRLDRIAEYFAGRVRDAVRQKDGTSADSALSRLKQLFPEYRDLPQLQNDVRKLRTSLAQAATRPPPKVETPRVDRRLLPVGINQNQDDASVVQDIVGLFIQYFENQDLLRLQQIAQISGQQKDLFSNLFTLYRSVRIELVPQSLTINKRDGAAEAKFRITDLVDKNNRQVVTSAAWTKVRLHLERKDELWLKAQVGNY